MAYMTYLPLGTLIGAVKGTADEEKWKPCMESLDEELRVMDLTSMEQRFIDEALSRRGVSGLSSLNEEPSPFEAALKAGIKTVLQGKIQRLQIKECTERGKFCLDMALHARLWDNESGRIAYSKVFVYSGLSDGNRPYEVMAWPRPTCRKMELYCKGGGREIFRREITSGLERIAEMISADITAH
jgi:hypothetical protein